MNYRPRLSSDGNKSIARAKDALGRLRANPTDAVAVMALYETCARELQEVAAHYFGKNQLGNKAVLNLLAAVVSRARNYDPQSINASEWIRGVADAEARRLLEKRDAGGSKRTRRAM